MNRMVYIASAVWFCGAAAGFAATPAPVGKASSPLSHDQPVEVTSDKLDVFQDEHKAVFTGNVLAVQGTTNMRAAQMTVFYSQPDDKAKPGASPPPASNNAGSGITRIEATGNVVFTTPTETAQGDLGIYNVETNTIDLIGKIVTLTRDQNVLKGTKLNYNMDAGRSVLTSGSAPSTSAMPSQTGRVHGLFVPKAKPAAAPAKSTAGSAPTATPSSVGTP